MMTTADTFLLSGTLGGTQLPPDADWTGATLALFVRNPGGRRVVNGAALTSFTLADKTFTYNHGAPLSPPVPGPYSWEVHVTFADATVEVYPGSPVVTLDRAVSDS